MKGEKEGQTEKGETEMGREVVEKVEKNMNRKILSNAKNMKKEDKKRPEGDRVIREKGEELKQKKVGGGIKARGRKKRRERQLEKTKRGEKGKQKKKTKK